MDRPIKSKTGHLKKLAVSIVSLLVLMVLVIYFTQDELQSTVLTVSENEIRSSLVREGLFEDFIPLRATVVPLERVFLDTIEGGRVEEVFVENGASVIADQLILRLSNPSLQLDVISREAEVTEQLNNLNTLNLQLEQNRLSHKRKLIEVDWKIARLEPRHKRISALKYENHVSEEEIELIEEELNYWRNIREATIEAQQSDEKLQKAQKAQLETAVVHLERNLDFARANLASLEVRASIAGQLTSFEVLVGQSLQKGERIGQIDSPDSFKLTTLIDEFYINRIEIGQSVGTEIQNTEFQLTVSKVYPEVQNGEFRADTHFEGSPPENLKTGQAFSARLNFASGYKALVVDHGSFLKETGGTWVFVFTEDRARAERRSVKLGQSNNSVVEVIEGLQEGEEIVISTYRNYADFEFLRID